ARQLIAPGDQEAFERGGKLVRPDGHRPRAGVPPWLACFLEEAQELLEVQRIAVRPPNELVFRRGVEPFGHEQIEKFRSVLLAQRSRLELERAMRVVRDRTPSETPSLRFRLGAERRREEQRRRLDDLEEAVGELSRRAAGPVKVLHREDKRSLVTEGSRPCAVGGANILRHLLSGDVVQLVI